MKNRIDLLRIILNIFIKNISQKYAQIISINLYSFLPILIIKYLSQINRSCKN
jgi:hypothetical protein